MNATTRPAITAPELDAAVQRALHGVLDDVASNDIKLHVGCGADDPDECSLFWPIYDAVAALDAEWTAMRAVCGPRCPKCGHFLKAEHCVNMTEVEPFVLAYFRTRWYNEAITRGPCLTQEELRLDYPEIAKEMSL